MDPQDFYFGQLSPTAYPRSNLGNSYGPGYSPVAAPQPFQPRFGMENLPFSGNLLSRMTLPMIAHQMIQGQQVALTGYGHDQNTYDVMRNRQLMFAQRESAKLAAQFDKENYMKTIRGGFRMAGEPFDMNQRRFARTVAGGMAAISPYMAEMAPDLMDQMGGMAGSASVLSRRLFDAGRYQIDPVSGRFGLSPHTVSAMTRDIYQTALRTPSRFGSLTSGQLGDLYGQLQSRGMTSTSYDPLGSLAALDPYGLSAAAKRNNVNLSGGIGSLGTKDVDKLLGDTQVATKLRSFDAVRVKQTLENYAKAIDSVKDIMGDNGEHNAPMQRIFAALEELSMGSMNKLGAGRTAQIVGQTYAISKRVGMPIENVLGMQRHAADLAQRLGLDPAFSMYSAQAGMLANGAYRNLGLGNQNYFGAMNVNEFTQMAANAHMTASASQSAKNLASIIRAYESNPSGSPQVVKNIVEAAKKGQSYFVDPATGKARNLVFDQPTTLSFMQQTGLSAASSQQIMRQDYRNQEIILQHNLGKPIADVGQGDEYRNLAADQTSAIISMKLGGTAVGTATEKIASDVSGKIINDIGRMSNKADMTNPEKVKSVIKKHLDAHPEYAKLSATERKQIERELSMELPGHLDEMTRNSVFSSYGNFTNAMVGLGEDKARAMSRINEQASFDKTMREAMRPLNKGGGLLQRLVGSLQDIKLTDRATIGSVMGGILGVSSKEVDAKMRDALVKVETARRSYDETRQSLTNATGPERDRLLKDLETKEAALKAASGEATDIATKEGIISERGFGKKDLADLGRMRVEGLTVGMELSGMAYGFSTQTTKQQQDAAIAAAMRRASPEDAMLYAMTVRRAQGKTGAPSREEIAAAQKALMSGKLGMDSPTTAKFGMVLANRDRDMISSRATHAEVMQQMANPRFAGLNRDEVASALNMDRIAAKLGLSESEIGVGANDPVGRASAIRAAIQKRQEAYYKPGPGELAAFANTPEGKGLTGEALGEAYFKSKRAAREAQYEAMQASGGEQLIRDQEDDFEKQIQDVSSRIMEAGRRGQASTENLEDAQGITKLLAEQRNLVDSYYGGDIVRARTNRSTLGNTREERDLERATVKRLGEIQEQLYGYAGRAVGSLQGGAIGKISDGSIAGDKAKAKFLRGEVDKLFGGTEDFAKLSEAMKLYHAQGGDLSAIEDFNDAKESLTKEAAKAGVSLTDFLGRASSDDDVVAWRSKYLVGKEAGYDKADIGKLRSIQDKYKAFYTDAAAKMGDSHSMSAEYLKLFGVNSESQIDSLSMVVDRRGTASILGRLEDAKDLSRIAQAARGKLEGGSAEDKVKASLLATQAIPTLIGEFDKASGSAEGLSAFRKAYGLTSDADFAGFKQKLGRQRRLLDRGGELDVGKLLHEFEEAAPGAGTGSEGKGKNELVFPKDARLTLSGSVTLDGGKMVLDARTSGQLTNA